jgi:ribose-phosphate pyrophosphokinase
MKDVVLLADPKSKAWGFAKKIQNYIEKNKEELVPLHQVSIEFFNNGEIDMFVPENIRKKHVYFIHDSSKDPLRWWVELMMIKDLLLSASVESVSFVLPNMLYSRKDRKDRSRVPITARALANSISTGLKRIITIDLHASQIQGFYPQELPLDNLYSFPEVVKYLAEYHLKDIKKLVVVSPDSGGVERAKSFLGRLERLNNNFMEEKEFSFALISKTRKKPGEVDNMQLVGDVKDKDVLVIDDIIDTGGTLIKAAKLLKEKGANKIMCYATHGIFTQGVEDLRKHFDAVLTSNTHFWEGNSVEVIDMSGLIAEAIYRAQKGLSISRLFD